MVQSRVSALADVGTVADGDWLYIVDKDAGGAGVHIGKRVDMTAITNYIEQRGRQNNAGVANQGAGFAADTYLTGSFVVIPAGRLQAKSKYRLRFFVSKTAAGIATPIITVRLGTAGATTDTARATLTHTAQTGVVDTGVYDLSVNFRTVGSGTSAVLVAGGVMDHVLAATGLSVSNTSVVTAVSAGFDSTVAGLGIGVSVNGGTSAAWTVQLVEAELYNLA